jgi:hypothetical protein
MHVQSYEENKLEEFESVLNILIDVETCNDSAQSCDSNQL